MTNNTAITPAVESGNNNVIFLPTAETNTKSASTSHGAKTSASSYGQNDCPPKEDINSVGRAVGTFSDQQPDLEYRRKNYPVEYKRWDNMKQRCRTDGAFLDPRFKKFKDFMSHMRPMRHPDDTVDRIDHNNPEYGPDNCRWASKPLQTANRSNTRYLTDNTGLRLSAKEWSTRGPRIPANTILNRVDKQGYSEHEAVHLQLYARRKTSSPTSPPILGATDCNRKKGKSEKSYQFEDIADLDGDFNLDQLTSPGARIVVLLRNVLVEDYGQEFFKPQPKHVGDANKIINRLAPELNGKKVLHHVIKNWGDKYEGFSKYARDNGDYKAPIKPSLPYILYNFNTAANFYIEQRKKRKEEKRSAKKERKRQKQVKKRDKVIEAMINADPDFMGHDKLYGKHLAKETLPNYGMTSADHEIHRSKSQCFAAHLIDFSDSEVWEKKKRRLAYARDQAYGSAKRRAARAWQHEQKR